MFLNTRQAQQITYNLIIIVIIILVEELNLALQKYDNKIYNKWNGLIMHPY